MLLGFINLRYSQFDPHLFSIQLCFLTPINDLKHVILYDRALYVTCKYVQCIVQLYYTYMYTYAAHSLKGSGHQLPIGRRSSPQTTHLRHQPGLLQPNSMSTLATCRPCQTPQVRGPSSEPAPNTSDSRGKCRFSPAILTHKYKSEVPQNPSSGVTYLLERLAELRNALFTGLRLSHKDTTQEQPDGRGPQDRECGKGR